MKKNLTLKILAVCISLIPLLTYFLLYSRIPATVPIHFDINSNPDSMASKSDISIYILFATALLMFIFYTILFQVISYVMKKNNNTNVLLVKKVCDVVLIMITASISSILVYYAFAISNIITYNINHCFIIVTIGLGFIFIILANYLPKFTKNNISGFRTKELVSDSEQWYLWHRKISRIWLIGGLLILLSSVFIRYIGFISILSIDSILISLMVIIPVIQIKMKSQT